MKRITQHKAAIAVVGSFAVYLIPIFTVHVSMLWGVVLWMEVTQHAAARGYAWVAADLGLALILQTAAGGLIYWMMAGRGVWRFAVSLAAAPGIALALQAGYLLAIPTLFLIEGETEGEKGDWPAACTLPNASVAAAPGGYQASLAQAGEAWITLAGSKPGSRTYAILTAPGCAVRTLPLTTYRTVLRQVIPGGKALYGVHDEVSGLQRLFVLDRGQEKLELARPKGLSYWHPVLAPHGGSVAWLDRAGRSGKGGPQWQLWTRTLDGADERALPVHMERPGAIELLAFDGTGPRFLARRNGREIVIIDGKGWVLPLADAPRVGSQPTQGYQRLPQGWISWDIYREKGRHRIAWTLNGRAGRRAVRKGRGIQSVSVSADGRMIAVSVGPNRNIGSVKDAVFVMRADDGKEIYRRFLRSYTRSRPVFLGRRHLAFTVIAGGKPSVRVLRIPEADTR